MLNEGENNIIFQATIEKIKICSINLIYYWTYIMLHYILHEKYSDVRSPQANFNFISEKN